MGPRGERTGHTEDVAELRFPWHRFTGQGSRARPSGSCWRASPPGRVSSHGHREPGGGAGTPPAGAGSRSRAGGAGRWWRRRSLRARVTLASTAGLALALAAAAVLLTGALRLSLIRSLDNSARQGAREVAALADAHRLPTRSR